MLLLLCDFLLLMLLLPLLPLLPLEILRDPFELILGEDIGSLSESESTSASICASTLAFCLVSSFISFDSSPCTPSLLSPGPGAGSIENIRLASTAESLRIEVAGIIRSNTPRRGSQTSRSFGRRLPGL